MVSSALAPQGAESDRDPQLSAKKPAVAPPENLALLDALTLHLANYCDDARVLKNQSPTSILWYRKSFQNYQTYLTQFLSLPPTEFAIRARTVESWAKWNRERGLSAISTNTLWRGLRCVFKYIEKKTGTPSPFRGATTPPLPRTEPKAKTADECRRILDAAEHYPWASPYTKALAQALIQTMLFAGLRRGELIQLKYADVQLAERTILIRHGKGAYGGRDRRAYISHDLGRTLTAYLRERERRGFVNPEFFTSPKTGQGLSFYGLLRIVKAVRRASGVAFSAHMLRHSFVSHLLASDVPLHIVSKLAGHRQISTTMGYAAIFDKDLADGIEKLRF